MIDIKSQIIKPALDLEDLRVVASAEGWKLTDLRSLGFFLERNFKYRRAITITSQSGSVSGSSTGNKLFKGLGGDDIRMTRSRVASLRVRRATPAYKREITITELSGNDLTDYPVCIDLDATNFDFSHAKSNGEDVRFVDENGNLLYHWIQQWDVSSKQARIWVKVPSIPANSTKTIFMYYGSAKLSWGRAPPTTIFPKGTTILDINNLLAENMVYDPDTGKWWLIFNDRTVLPWGIGFAYADNPEGPWTRDSYVYQGPYEINSPSFLPEKIDGYWYIFFGMRCNGAADIYCIKSTTINRGYGDPIGPLVTKGGSGDWNEIRSDEPQVLRIPDYKDLGLPNEYVMVYMGQDNTEWKREVTGIAWAPHPEGPWTEYENNPVIPVEYPDNPPEGKWNNRTKPTGNQAPDPFIFRYEDTFYIGVTGDLQVGESVIARGIGLYYTKDFVNFEEYPYNPIYLNGFRGGITEYNGYYYLTYTLPWPHGCGLTKVEVNRLGKDPYLVLFYDDFEAHDVGAHPSTWVQYKPGFRVSTEDTNKILAKTGTEDSALSFRFFYGKDSAIIEGKLKHLDSYYLTELTMVLEKYMAVFGYGGELRIEKDDVLQASKSFSASANVWYDVKFIFQNGRMKIIINGESLEWTDTSPYIITNCGVRCGGTQKGAFDNIIIRKGADPEPSVSVGAEESA